MTNKELFEICKKTNWVDCQHDRCKGEEECEIFIKKYGVLPSQATRIEKPELYSDVKI